MTISVEKLSLLGSLEQFRQKSDSNTVQQSGGFAESLDKALGGGDIPTSVASGKARELAESLTMQMLQRSLSLTSDSPSDSMVSSGATQYSSVNSLMQAYQNNIAAGDERLPETPPSSKTQIHELSIDVPANSPVLAQASRSYNDASWLDPIISKASRKYGVDVGLIRAVIKTESDFNPQAVSHAGACGLMQLMPATARSLGVSDSFDPEQNVMGGTRFLKDMLQRYNGNVDSALAAYNWGPGNVDKRPDHLPRETREYLARVKQLYASYSG